MSLKITYLFFPYLPGANELISSLCMTIGSTDPDNGQVRTEQQNKSILNRRDQPDQRWPFQDSWRNSQS